MSRRRAMLLVAALAIQAILPLAARMAGPPQPFGWQMFATTGRLDIEVENASGEPVEIDRSDLMVRNRPEMNWARLLPERICHEYPQAARVEIRTVRTEREVRCSG